MIYLAVLDVSVVCLAVQVAPSALSLSPQSSPLITAVTAAFNTRKLNDEPVYGWYYYSGVMVRLKAGQQAVKRASFATVASLGSFGSDVTHASRMFARDAPAVARRVQQDLGSAALHVHHSVRDAFVTAGTGLCHATQQVGFVGVLPEAMRVAEVSMSAITVCWCQQVCFVL